MEWLGSDPYVVDILLSLLGVVVLVAVSRITETNRSRQYLLPGFCCWVGFELLLGLEAGGLVSVPRPVGLVGSVVLLAGFVGLSTYGFAVVWMEHSTESAA